MSAFLPLPPGVVQHLSRFAEPVEAYCALVENRATYEVEEFLRQAHVLLARLYHEGLNLPSTDILFADEDGDEDEIGGPRTDRDPDRLTQEAWAALYRDLGTRLDAANFYREIFDPWELEGQEEVIGSLSDDLSDIYGDLRSGLAKWRRGEQAEALWEWRSHFEIHWGEHAMGALRAIHIRASNPGGRWPPTEGSAT